MSNTLANSFIGAGGAKAFEHGTSPERMASRSAAYADKEKRDQELRNLQATEPTVQDRKTMAETQSLELQNALETQKQMMRGNNKQTVFNAYQRYDGDSDVKHINTMIEDLRASGSNLYGQIARVDKITENDKAMIQKAYNLSPQMVNAIITDPELNKSFIIYTQTDGTKAVGSIDDLKALQGYNNYATEEEITRQERTNLLMQIATFGYEPNSDTLEAFRRAQAEMPNGDPNSSDFQLLVTEKMKEVAAEKRRASNNVNTSVGGTGNPTELEAQAMRIASSETGLDPSPPGENTEWDEAYRRAMVTARQELRPGSKQKYEESVQASEDNLLEMGFMDYTQEELNNLTATERVKIEREVRQLENLGEANLSETDKKHLLNIRKLAGMGDLAGDLTDEQTGIIDSVLRTAKKYLFNDVSGIEAESAYSAFRNLVKHALYGASLQPGESSNFLKQFGSLGQQRGPVLQQLRTTMEELKHAYEGIAAVNNDMVIKWRTGSTKEDLYNVLDALDDRIEFIDNIKNGNPVTTITEPLDTTKKVELTPDVRLKLDNLNPNKNKGVQ